MRRLALNVPVPAAAVAVLVGLLVAATASAAVIRLDQRANGKTIHARVGDRIVLTLRANASTGYAWSPTVRGMPVVRLDAVRYVAAPTPGLLGAPGRYVARLTVRTTGRSTLVLVYRRQTRPATAPAARFALTVVSTRR